MLSSLVLACALPGQGQAQCEETTPALPGKLYQNEAVVHSVREPAFARYWSDQADLISWNGPFAKPPVVHTGHFTDPDGRGLVVTSISSPELCKINGCPVRIQFDQGQRLAKFMACDLTEDHHLSPDGRTFIACDEKFSIPKTVPEAGTWADIAPEPAPKSDLYTEERNIASPNDPAFSAYWADLAKDIDWNAPAPAFHFISIGHFKDGHGRELVATTIHDPYWCGIKYCPIRIFTEKGDLLVEQTACNASEYHRISSDRRYFIACGQTFRIPESPAKPASVGAPAIAMERIAWDDGLELENPQTLQDYWNDKTQLVNWKAPRFKRGRVYNWPFHSADGRDLVLTTLQSSAGGACDPLCPVRVFTARHKKIMEILACSDRAQHGLSADHRSFVACGEIFPIPQVDDRAAIMDNAPINSDPEAYVEVVRIQRSKPANAPKPINVDSALHNNSQVLISEWKDGTVEITYDVPRPGLPVAQGTLLFHGVRNGTRYSGTAYTFKAGCPPASYAVTGMKDQKSETIVLTGAAPHRDPRSCDVIADSSQSGHAKLVFDTRFYGDE